MAYSIRRLSFVMMAGLCGALACQKQDTGTHGQTQKVVIGLAASSLCDVFATLEDLFEAQHPQWDLRVACDGSQRLRLQVEEGAPADWFATADPEQVAILRSQGLAGESASIANWISASLRKR